MIRNLFKRIAQFFTGSSSDDDNSAIPFAEHSRKKAAELSKKERAERQRRARDKKQSPVTKTADRPQKGTARGKSDVQSEKRVPSSRATRSQNGKATQQAPQRKVQKEKPVKETQRQPRKPAWSLDEFQVPEKEGEVRFHDLDLPVKLMRGIFDLGFQYTTPIQAGCLPETLKGRDAIGKAQTGTGKSAAFLITIINHLAKHPMRGGPEKGFPRALVLAPTRELALQIEKDARNLCKFTPYRILSLFGGTGYDKQKKGMAGSVDIVVATPGRLIDFKNQKLVDLSRVEILVIDEADRMLDMGFIPDIRKIVYATPHKDQRQTLFFSATYSSDVTRLAEQWTRDPHRVEIEPEKVESESVDQKVFLVTTDEKFPLLYNLIHTRNLTKVLVFTNRRDQARRLAERLNKYKVKADLLSGEVAQNKRIRALEDFRSGKVQVLVATDVAARGLHIDEISHVINYNLPQDAEHYVHRIGRTGRAGATGTSVSFACEEDSYYIPAIEELLGHKLSCEYPEDTLLVTLPSPTRTPKVRQESEDEPQKQPRKKSPRTRQSQEEKPKESAGATEDEKEKEEGVGAEKERAEKTTPPKRAPRRRSHSARQAAQKENGPKEPTGKKPEGEQPKPEKKSKPQAKPKLRKTEAPLPLFTEDKPEVLQTKTDHPKEALATTPDIQSPGETVETEVKEEPTNPLEPNTKASPKPRHRPKAPRTTRTPHAPKYKKKPGNRYSKTPTRRDS